MSTKSKVGCFFGILSLGITQPLWYYLLFQVLVRVEATELMWAAYWVYLPVGIVLALGNVIAQSVFEEK